MTALYARMSFSFGIGIGASAVISRAIGEGDQHRVRRLTTDSLLLVSLIIICVAAISFFSLGTIFTLIGATEESIQLIKEYMVPWLAGVVFVVIPIVGNSAIRATGDTKTPSWIMMIAAGVNTVLDPLLIFGYGPFPELGITALYALPNLVIESNNIITSFLCSVSLLAFSITISATATCL